MTNKEISIFCNNVKVLRKRSGLNREEMAHICGISVPELIQIEQGSLPEEHHGGYCNSAFPPF